jgi:hypothetical protein
MTACSGPVGQGGRREVRLSRLARVLHSRELSRDGGRTLREDGRRMKMLEKFWFGCGHSHCQQCPMADAAEATDRERTGFEAGTALVVSALAVFILPIVTAVTGAWLGGTWWADATTVAQYLWQAGGALAGLALGIGAAKALILVMERRRAASDGVGR